MNEIPATLAANLTRDPELRFTPSGQAVASVGLAVTPRRYDAETKQFVDGETTFADAAVWGKQAEQVAESLHKGNRVIVLGRWVTRVFTPQSGRHSGETVRKLEIVVDEIGPSLRWAPAEVTKAASRDAGTEPAGDGDEPPF